MECIEKGRTCIPPPYLCVSKKNNKEKAVLIFHHLSTKQTTKKNENENEKGKKKHEASAPLTPSPLQATIKNASKKWQKNIGVQLPHPPSLLSTYRPFPPALPSHRPLSLSPSFSCVPSSLLIPTLSPVCLFPPGPERGQVRDAVRVGRGERGKEGCVLLLSLVGCVYPNPLLRGGGSIPVHNKTKAKKKQKKKRMLLLLLSVAASSFPPPLPPSPPPSLPQNRPPPPLPSLDGSGKMSLFWTRATLSKTLLLLLLLLLLSASSSPSSSPSTAS